MHARKGNLAEAFGYARDAKLLIERKRGQEPFSRGGACGERKRQKGS